MKSRFLLIYPGYYKDKSYRFLWRSEMSKGLDELSFVGINLTSVVEQVYNRMPSDPKKFTTDDGSLAFTTKIVSEIIGINSNTMHYYIEAGGIVPDIDKSSGTGTKRLFSETNLVEAGVLFELMLLHIPKRESVSFLRRIRNNNDRDKLNPINILKGNS